MAVNLSPVAGAAAQFFDNSGQVLTGGKLYTYDAGTTTPSPTYTSSNGVTAHPNPIILNAAGRVPDSGEIWLADSVSYKFVLKDTNDVLIGTYDNLVGINSNFVNFTGEEEKQTATQGQTVFTLATLNYQPATNNLLIFVNGSKQISGTNYIETSSTVVTFVDGLNVGDVVDFCTATPINTSVVTAAQVSYNQGDAGAVTRTVESKLQESVSVLDFGAVMNDIASKAINTTALISALASSKSVYIPEGTLYINAGINLEDVLITGEGINISFIEGDGNLFTINTLYKAPTLRNLTIQNGTTTGILITQNQSTASGGVICESVWFGKATTHYSAASLVVGTRFENCFFTLASSFSRIYGAGSFVCIEQNCSTTQGGGGLKLTGSKHSSFCIQNAAMEYLQNEAIKLDGTGTTAIQNTILTNIHFENCSLASPATVPYVNILGGAGNRLWDTNFNQCTFATPPTGLVRYVYVSQPSGSSVRNVNFNGGAVEGNVYLANDTSAVFSNTIIYNNDPPYGVQPTNIVPLLTPKAYSLFLGATQTIGVAGGSGAVQASIAPPPGATLAIIYAQGTSYNGTPNLNSAFLNTAWAASGARFTTIVDVNNGTGSNQGFVATWDAYLGQIVVSNKAAMTANQSGTVNIVFYGDYPYYG